MERQPGYGYLSYRWNFLHYTISHEDKDDDGFTVGIFESTKAVPGLKPLIPPPPPPPPIPNTQAFSRAQNGSPAPSQLPGEHTVEQTVRRIA